MNQLLAQIGERQVAGFLLVLGRVGPLLVLAPLFGFKMIPSRARVIIALALTVGIAPVALGDAKIPTDTFAYVELMFKEILVGFAFAYAIGAVLWALQMAGALIDLLLGFSFGSLVDPLSGVNATVISNLYAMVGVAIFIAIGGDALVIQGLAQTYQVIPLTEMPRLGSLVAGVDLAFVQILRSALEVVAPVLIAVTIADIAFGLVSRVVPQLNVFAVGFPAKIVVGLFVLIASMPFLGGWFSDELNSSMRQILGVMG